MTGADGSSIRDERKRNSIPNDDPNRNNLIVTFYENSNYRLNIQLNCERQTNLCDVDQNVDVWIDFNDNGFDQSERRTGRFSPSNVNQFSGQFQMDISIPSIDRRYIQSGFHRMRVNVTPTEEYQRDCGYTQRAQTRDYTVNLIQKTTYQSNL